MGNAGRLSNCLDILTQEVFTTPNVASIGIAEKSGFFLSSLFNFRRCGFRLEEGKP
jgi:hypothetical protein